MSPAIEWPESGFVARNFPGSGEMRPSQGRKVSVMGAVVKVRVVKARVLKKELEAEVEWHRG